MSAVWDHSTFDDPLALLILLALADHADAEGECWPSVESLAHKSRSSRRTVQRVVADAVERGELVRVLGSGRGHTNLYRFTLPGSVDNVSTKGVSVAPIPAKGRQGERERASGTTVKGVTGGAQNHQESSEPRARARHARHRAS